MKKKALVFAIASLFVGSMAFGACADKTKSADNEAEETEMTEETPAAPATPDAEGYITTPSGLKYKVIKEGEGAHPTPTSVVSAKYTGKLLDGTVFDSTDNRGGQPAQFPLNGVIPGWTEGLQLMQPGAIYEFIIPPYLGYGSRDTGPIPANSTLIFEVELVDIQ